jgi:hypothetical protein
MLLLKSEPDRIIGQRSPSWPRLMKKWMPNDVKLIWLAMV